MRQFAPQPAFLARAREVAARVRAPSGLAQAEVSLAGRLYLYDVIGADPWTGGGITATAVAAALDALTAAGAKSLEVFINSPGGDVSEGVTIFETLRRFGGTKTVRVDGIAASAASLIAMAGDRIITSPSGMWMVHEAWTFACGGSGDLRKTAEVLDICNGSMAIAYAARTKRSLEQCRAVMAAETWMSADEALALGFTDEVACPDCGKAPCECSDDQAAAEARVAALLANAARAQVASVNARAARITQSTRARKG